MSGKSDDKSNSAWFWPGNTSDNQPTNSKFPETDLEMDERLANIFKKLDRNGNGRIDIQDLTAALKGFGMSEQYAEVSVDTIIITNFFVMELTKILKFHGFVLIFLFNRNFSRNRIAIKVAMLF